MIIIVISLGIDDWAVGVQLADEKSKHLAIYDKIFKMAQSKPVVWEVTLGIVVILGTNTLVIVSAAIVLISS